MIYRIDVRITAHLYPTEVTAHVVDAIRNVFPNAEVTVCDDEVRATTHSLARFSELLHRREILDTARTEFFAGADPGGFSFSIKKQPATRGIVTFTVDDESELGEIEVDVRVSETDVESVIDHVAPPTVDGVPVTRLDER